MKKFRIVLMLALTALILSACAEELKETGPKEEAPIQSKTGDPVTDYDKISQVLENSTYLRGQAATFKNLTDKNCKDAKLIEELKEQIGEINEGNKNSPNNEIGPIKEACEKNGRTYVVFESKGPANLISLWEGGKTFEFFKDEKNETAFYGSDATVAFFPEVLNGKSIVYVSAKDEPVYSWTFYLLDHETTQSTLIEQCELEFEYGAKNSFIMADKSELRCEKQYKLVN